VEIVLLPFKILAIAKWSKIIFLVERFSSKNAKYEAEKANFQKIWGQN